MRCQRVNLRPTGVVCAIILGAIGGRSARTAADRECDARVSIELTDQRVRREKVKVQQNQHRTRCVETECMSALVVVAEGGVDKLTMVGAQSLCSTNSAATKDNCSTIVTALRQSRVTWYRARDIIRTIGLCVARQ